MRIAVAGGTGLVGRLVVEELNRVGHDSVALSRATGVDLMTGAGVYDAIAGADAVIDVTSVITTKREKAIEFFTTVTTNLRAAEVRAGVGHHVALSIVGIDKVPTGYYAGKLCQEQAVAAGPVAWSLLRATQFHEFALQMLARASLGPMTVVPKMASQPVAAREVAAALVDLAVKPAAGRVADLAGPQSEDMADMVRRLAEVRGERRIVIPLRLPGAGWKATREGALRPASGARLGTQTYAEWLMTDAATGEV